MRSLRREMSARVAHSIVGWTLGETEMDEFTQYRKSSAITKFSDDLEKLCEKQSGTLYYAEIVGVLTTHAMRFALESIEEELGDSDED